MTTTTTEQERDALYTLLRAIVVAEEDDEKETFVTVCARWLLQDLPGRVALLAQATEQTGAGGLSSVFRVEEAAEIFDVILVSVSGSGDDGSREEEDAALLRLLALFDVGEDARQEKVEVFFDDATYLYTSSSSAYLPLQTWLMVRCLDVGRLDLARALAPARIKERWVVAWLQDAWAKQFRDVFFVRFDTSSRWRMDYVKWTELLCTANNFGTKFEFIAETVDAPRWKLSARTFLPNTLTPSTPLGECLVKVSLMKGAFEFFGTKEKEDERVDMIAFAGFMSQFHESNCCGN